MGTKSFITAILIVGAAVHCSGARERFGKLTRQARQVRPFSSAIDQAVVTNTISNQSPQAEQVQSAPAPADVPQTRQYHEQSLQPSLQPYQPVPQQLQQIQQQQYQPIQPQPNQVFPRQIAPQQYLPGVQQQVQPSQQYVPVVPPQPQTYPQPQIAYPQAQSPSPYDPSNIINQVSQVAPAYSQYVSVTTTRTLVDKLPSNATRIRPNLVEGFSCQGREYGYYADTLNGCQVFHVCYPLKKVFRNHPDVPDITYDFSFICNDFLAFDQSSLTCGWATEVVPCENAEELYTVANSKFFEVPKKTVPQGTVAVDGYPAPASVGPAVGPPPNYPAVG